METFEGNKRRKNFLEKTWNRWRSFPIIRTSMSKKKIVRQGTFPVHVGLEKQRFNVKTKYASHPLFTALLEDAESEYGYNSNGPILLACDVDSFYKVLFEMEAKEVQPYSYGSCSPFNPSRRLGSNGPHWMGKGYGSFMGLSNSIKFD